LLFGIASSASTAANHCTSLGILQTLETNLFGVIHGINTFLPVVKKASESKPTSIVITGSKQGITNPPGNPAYNASKAAVKSLAEQLSYDLRESSTSVHLLVPGWTFTNLVSYLLSISLCH
jgi:NAD(P)-dependent dehydrogenase (short-subunit alcohol dehydrogenase family)